LPKTESQVRPLTSLEPEIQKEVWTEVVKTHGDNITAAKVQTVVNDWKTIDFEVKEAKSNPMFSPDIEVIIEDKKSKAHVSNNSGENEWYTPECYIESAKKVMGNIDLDPASSEIANQTVKANLFYSQEEDGLSKEWFGNVWMNPPYSQPLIFQFIIKLVESNKINQAIVLVNNGTETQWGQLLLSNSNAVCFHQSRIRFIDKYGNLGQAPLQGQIICYIGSEVNNFINEFNKYGTIYKKG
jgi:ParB family chromosome partitioning protein